MDDGWFGRATTTAPASATGPSTRRNSRNGLKPLIDHVNGLGMDFGLWVEPEMVNADSDLYRAHPDWVIHFAGRPRSELRNQMVLNLARTDVKEYIFGVLDKLASDYNIRYFKWDMNRAVSEPGWPDAGAVGERKLWVDYVRNLYDIIDRLRANHPQARDRILLRRRRPHRSRHPPARRRGVALRQHRSVRPPADPGRVHHGVRAENHVGVGYRCAEHERPQRSAALPLSGGDARRARRRRESQ